VNGGEKAGCFPRRCSFGDGRTEKYSLNKNKGVLRADFIGNEIEQNEDRA